MNKNILMFFCLCLTAGLLWVHFSEHAVTSEVPSRNITTRPLAVSTTSAAQIKPVAKVPLEQMKQCSNTLVALVEPVIINGTAQTNIVTDNGNEKTEQEKYRLLRELRELAAKDPEAALAGAMKLPAGDERNQALAAVCFGVAETDPADGVKMAKSLNLDGQPGAIIENLAQQWAMTDLPSALDWANSQPAGSERDGLTTRIAYIMSQSDPTDAAKLVINQIPSGPAQDEAVMTVLNQWANQNLVVAATWAKGLPAGPLQARAINELEGIESHQQALAHQ